MVEPAQKVSGICVWRVMLWTSPALEDCWRFGSEWSCHRLSSQHVCQSHKGPETGSEANNSHKEADKVYCTIFMETGLHSSFLSQRNKCHLGNKPHVQSCQSDITKSHFATPQQLGEYLMKH